MSERSATIRVPHEKLSEVLEIAAEGKCKCAISVTITGNTDTRRSVYQAVSKLLGDHFKPTAEGVNATWRDVYQRVNELLKEHPMTGELAAKLAKGPTKELVDELAKALLVELEDAPDGQTPCDPPEPTEAPPEVT